MILLIHQIIKYNYIGLQLHWILIFYIIGVVNIITNPLLFHPNICEKLTTFAQNEYSD